MRTLVSLIISFSFAAHALNCGDVGSEVNSPLTALNSFYKRLSGTREGLNILPRELINFHGLSVQNGTIGCEYEVRRREVDGTTTFLFTVPAQKVYVVKDGQDVCPSMLDIE